MRRFSIGKRIVFRRRDIDGARSVVRRTIDEKSRGRSAPRMCVKSRAPRGAWRDALNVPRGTLDWISSTEPRYRRSRWPRPPISS